MKNFTAGLCDVLKNISFHLSPDKKTYTIIELDVEIISTNIFRSWWFLFFLLNCYVLKYYYFF